MDENIGKFSSLIFSFFSKNRQKINCFNENLIEYLQKTEQDIA